MWVKVAIASEGDSMSSQVSAVGARSPYYLLSEDGKQVKAVKNPFQSGGGGAGFAVASMLADEGVQLIISQSFGENMTGALAGRNIRWNIVKPMKVEDALKELKSW